MTPPVERQGLGMEEGAESHPGDEETLSPGKQEAVPGWWVWSAREPAGSTTKHDLVKMYSVESSAV